MRLSFTPLVLSLSLFSLSCVTPLSAAFAEQRSIEFWHWWNSASEVENANTLNHYLQRHGLLWNDKKALKSSSSIYLEQLSQQLQQHYPDAAMLDSSMVYSYNQSYPLMRLDEVAKEQGWDEVIPLAIQERAKHQGHWISAPLNSHSSNWLWVNKDLFSRLAIPEPQTWADLIAVLERAKALNIPALATPRDDWEKVLLLELVIMSTGGLEFYRRLFVEQHFRPEDEHTLAQSFLNLKQLTHYFSANTHNISWDQATAKVAQGEVLMQIHGSWVNSELTTLAAVANQDFLCLRFPGTQGAYIFNSDHVVFFTSEDKDLETQKQLAGIFLDKDFQRSLSIASGASPARVDVTTDGFNYCSKKSIHELRMANTRRGVMPSINNKTTERIVVDFLQQRSTAEDAAQKVLDIAAHLPASTPVNSL